MTVEQAQYIALMLEAVVGSVLVEEEQKTMARLGYQWFRHQKMSDEDYKELETLYKKTHVDGL